MSDDFSEAASKTIHATVGQWFEAFADSPAFAKLNESQQRKAGPIVNFFTEYSHTHLGLSPADWDCDAVYECCLEILPRKISAELSLFQAIGPVLSAFFRFLSAQSFHPSGHALAEAVDDIADDIVHEAKTPQNWGPAKQFVMAAQNAGVDVGDEKSMLAYVLQYNQQLAARFQSTGARPGPENPYDPCSCGSGKKFKFCCKQRG